MIDVKELRVGNHVDVRINDVIYRQGTRICRINDNNEVCYEVVNDGLHSAYAIHLQPIPLTADLLTEIGFRYHEYDNGKLWEMEFDDLYHGHFCLEYDEDSSRYNLTMFNMKEIEIYAHCKYLHELENWVYMVYGKELIEE